MKKLGFFAIQFFLMVIAYSDTYVDIAAGENHTLILNKEGKIFSFGANHYGQLGQGTISESELCCQIHSKTRFISVAAGKYHSLAVADDGTLWGWGYKNAMPVDFPERLKNIKLTCPHKTDFSHKWKKVFANNFLSFAITDNGKLWGWGGTDHMEMGYWHDRINLIENADNTKWKTLEAFEDYILAEDENRTLWSWGDINDCANNYSYFNAYRPEKNGYYEMQKLLPPKDSQFFSMNMYACSYKKKDIIYLSGLQILNEVEQAEKVVSSLELYRMNEGADDQSHDKWLLESNKREKITACAYLFTGSFINQDNIMRTIVYYNYKMQAKLPYSVYTFCLTEDNTAILWTNGKRFEKKLNKKIIKVWGGYSIFAQTEDGKLYAIGYNTNRRLGIDTDDEDTFYFLTPVYK